MKASHTLCVSAMSQRQGSYTTLPCEGKSCGSGRVIRGYQTNEIPSYEAIRSEGRASVAALGILTSPHASNVGSSTILPVTSPDSISRCASTARDSGNSFSIWALILPCAAAAKHASRSGGW